MRHLLVLGPILAALACSATSAPSSAPRGAACRAAGGSCTATGGAVCATRAANDAQDCESSPPDPAGSFCCLPGDGGTIDASSDASDATVPTDGGGDATPRDASASDASADATAADATPDDAAAGDDAGYSCSGASPSFANDVHPVLSCGGELCHGGIGPAFPYASLVNVAASRDTCAGAGLLVSPNHPEKSYLLNKLTGVGMCPGTDRMPKLGTPLGTTDMQTIIDWICQGAPNN